METTVGKKKFAVAKKKVAVAKKNFTPLLHKGVKSFFGAQRNAFSLTSSTLKVSKNAERCGTKSVYCGFALTPICLLKNDNKSYLVAKASGIAVGIDFHPNMHHPTALI